MTANSTISDPKVSVFQPDHETFDQFSIHGVFDHYVFVLLQAGLPPDFWRPMFDLASLYSPIVIVNQIPHCGTKDHYMKRLALYQAIPRYDLQKLLGLIEEDEAGWSIDGDMLISGTRTEISETDLIDVAEEHCKLPESAEVEDPIDSTAHLQPDSTVTSSQFSWRSALWCGVGVVLGLTLGLAF